MENGDIIASHINSLLGGLSIDDQDAAAEPEATTSSYLRQEAPDLEICLPVGIVKAWHHCVTTKDRNHFIYLLLQANRPNCVPQSVFSNSNQHSIMLMSLYEAEFYQRANSRSEYYHLVAEKVYNIQQELKERRRLLESAHQEVYNFSVGVQQQP